MQHWLIVANAVGSALGFAAAVVNLAAAVRNRRT